MRTISHSQAIGILLVLSAIVVFSRSNIYGAEGSVAAVYSDPTMPLIQMPIDFKTYRQNSNKGSIEAGTHYDLLDVRGPGCVRSIWLLRAEGKRIEIVADGAEVPQVDMPAPNFFGTLLGKEPYLINSAAMVSMPNEFMKKNFGSGEPGYTCYLPIPFQKSCRIRMHTETKGGLNAMVNWHKYPNDVRVTPYRFHVAHHVMNPAPPRGGQMTMADVSGKGFIAGIFMGVVQRTFDDLMYHQGGITFLIDGETDPHAIRGHNMEDDYGFTWGFHKQQSTWFGVPYHRITELENPIHRNNIASYAQEAVVYRFMGPDPVSFSSSMSMKTGTRPDHTETVVYYYKKQGTTSPEVVSPKRWQTVGVFPCKTREEFEADPPEEIVGNWNDTLTIHGRNGTVREVESDHAWVNFHPLYCTPAYTPFALTEQAVYARGSVESDQEREAALKIAFDDWMTVWMNGEKLKTIYHENDFSLAEIPVKLKKGKNEILVKSVNFDKLPNNRLWAFSLVVE